MNLTIDIGNTTTKIAIFDGLTMLLFKRIEGHNLSPLPHIAKSYGADHCIVCSTANITDEMKAKIESTGIDDIIYMSPETPVPITNKYKSPKTLGMDRLAAAIGAYYAGNGRHDLLVIDLGTAITYDLVTAKGEYLGGNISPGMAMRFKALHQYTAKLPLVKTKGPKPTIGVDTDTAIRSGVLLGIKYEIEGFIKSQIVKYPNLLIFLTGGNNIDFDDSIKKRTFADKYLVLKGLNRILLEKYM